MTTKKVDGLVLKSNAGCLFGPRRPGHASQRNRKIACLFSIVFFRHLTYRVIFISNFLLVPNTIPPIKGGTKNYLQLCDFEVGTQQNFTQLIF